MTPHRNLPHTVPEREIGLVLVDHGSRQAAANALLERRARELRERTGKRFAAVEPAHMELSEPTLEQAVARCVAAGARHVRIVLFFLSPGRHSASDIPRLAAAAAARHPGITWTMTPPLGQLDAVTDLVLLAAQSDPAPPNG